MSFIEFGVFCCSYQAHATLVTNTNAHILVGISCGDGYNCFIPRQVKNITYIKPYTTNTIYTQTHAHTLRMPGWSKIPMNIFSWGCSAVVIKALLLSTFSQLCTRTHNHIHTNTPTHRYMHIQTHTRAHSMFGTCTHANTDMILYLFDLLQNIFLAYNFSLL